ncbi:lytic transglycosylase domain-containing protein [Pararhodobacter sp. CCB-MM2]|uniref:lytic transglycosylase domain-containing protein n=1 Tax=Pararhodobacter sp. CCB-MM2 TaxID=1786003 RepID=UPI001F23FEEF|nr:lytic transglycosylase domain-containing protein [Pararhodobacter sp. CCB-MM2]
MKKSRLMIATLWLALAAAPQAWARAELCEAAAAAAAREAGVPVDVMLAISLTETGRRSDGRLRPWPWTANAEGEGHWFETRQEAADFARRLLARGQPLFDLGCFQINWRWHGENFSRPEDLLDPMVAGRYAAHLIARLHDEFGSWEGAAGAYHSRTPQYANRYRARFAEMRDSLRDAPLPDETVVATRADDAYPGGLRINTFPLLLADGAAATAPATGSLVPMGLTSARPLFEAAP